MTQNDSVFNGLVPSLTSENASIPVFQPNWEQFQNFNKFMEFIEPIGHEFGLIKIIPPSRWKAEIQQEALTNAKDLRIFSYLSASFRPFKPVKGIYQQVNNEKFVNMSGMFLI